MGASFKFQFRQACCSFQVYLKAYFFFRKNSDRLNRQMWYCKDNPLSITVFFKLYLLLLRLLYNHITYHFFFLPPSPPCSSNLWTLFLYYIHIYAVQAVLLLIFFFSGLTIWYWITKWYLFLFVPLGKTISLALSFLGWLSLFVY